MEVETIHERLDKTVIPWENAEKPRWWRLGVLRNAALDVAEKAIRRNSTPDVYAQSLVTANKAMTDFYNANEHAAIHCSKPRQ